MVFVPEPRDGQRWPDYDANRVWELRWGDRVDVVLFWMPFGPSLPGRTTRDEYGRWKDSGRVVLGVPPNAEHVRYQRDYATDNHIPCVDSLAHTVQHALELIGAGAHRSGGHRDVPLILYRTPSFAAWLSAQEAAGNELRGGRLEWTFRVDPDKKLVLWWAFHVQIYVAAEDRIKANEVVLSRPDIAAVVAYRRGETLRDTKVALVREFRSPATTTDGFAHELPGGSGAEGDLTQQASAELSEEIGLTIRPDQLRVHRARQPAVTVSAHRLHLFSIELDDDQLAELESCTTVLGNAEESERTYPEVRTVGQLLDGGETDLTTLGAVFQVLST